MSAEISLLVLFIDTDIVYADDCNGKLQPHRKTPQNVEYAAKTLSPLPTADGPQTL